MMMKHTACILVSLTAWTAWVAAPAACAAHKLEPEAREMAALFKKTDPGLQKFFDEARGYAIFPGVGKGAIGIGGAHGRGLVYEKDKLVGEASLSQITVGFQLGGQSYAELIFFETDSALKAFKESRVAFSAQISAVAAAEGASRNAKYQQGVAVFTLAKGGLMYEASIGGQKFKFKAVEE
jgi:lipid-binding SYLF domain-containing protein